MSRNSSIAFDPSLSDEDQGPYVVNIVTVFMVLIIVATLRLLYAILTQ